MSPDPDVNIGGVDWPEVPSRVRRLVDDTKYWVGAARALQCLDADQDDVEDLLARADFVRAWKFGGCSVGRRQVGPVRLRSD